MVKRIQTFADKVSSHITLWQLFWGGNVSVGIGTAWLASGADYINQYGVFGWWIAGLLGAALFSAVCAGAAAARYSWLRGTTLVDWRAASHSINPLDTQFNKVVIKAIDLADPVTRKVDGKTIVDCDIIGPANIVFMDNNHMQEFSFINCDVLPLREGALIMHAIPFYNCTIRKTRVANVTVYVPTANIDVFRQMGVSFIGYTRDEAQQRQ